MPQPSSFSKSLTAVAAVFAAATTVLTGFAVVEHRVQVDSHLARLQPHETILSYHFQKNQSPQIGQVAGATTPDDVAVTQALINEYQKQLSQDGTCWNNVILIEDVAHWPTKCNGFPDQDEETCPAWITQLTHEEKIDYTTWSLEDGELPLECS